MRWHTNIDRRLDHAVSASEIGGESDRANARAAKHEDHTARKRLLCGPARDTLVIGRHSHWSVAGYGNRLEVAAKKKKTAVDQDK